MKAFLSFLVGIIATVLTGAGVTAVLLSNNNVAIQIGGRENKIEQKLESHPGGAQSAPTQQPAPQPQFQPQTQPPNATTTQPPPNTSSYNTPNTAPNYVPAPAQSRSSVSRQKYNHTDDPAYLEECECTEEEAMAEDEPAETVIEEDVEMCYCEEEPPTL